METNIRHLILTNRNTFGYDDFVEYCEEENWDIDPEELEIPDEDSEEFMEWAYDQTEINYEADLDNIKNCKAYKVPVVITGKLGLWWGKPEIEPAEADSVYEAILGCIGDDIDYIDAEYADGVIYVSATHHDGTNHFEIRAKSGELPYLYAIGVN